jgi:hypothetical protein
MFSTLPQSFVEAVAGFALDNKHQAFDVLLQNRGKVAALGVVSRDKAPGGGASFQGGFRSIAGRGAC